MKVLHIDTEQGFRGGEQQVLWLMRGLRDRGVEQVAAVRAGSELATRLKAHDLAIHEMRRHQAWDPRALIALRRLARAEGFALVHAHTGNGHTLAWRAFEGRLPIVVTRRVDFAIRKNLFSRRKYAEEGTTFVAISSAVRDVLAAGGVDPARIVLVPSGIEPERFHRAEGREKLRRAWRVDEPGPLIGTVGAWVDHKDPLNLIEATPSILRELPTARVVFVGDGELREAMEDRARALGLADRIVFAGWRDDVGACLAAFDLFALPSKLEGLCTSLLDAQAVGVPCVACRAGGIPDIVEHGENGLLVPPRRPEALAEALVRLWGNDTLRTQFAARGPEVVRERFTVDAMVEGTENVYKRALTEWAEDRAKG